MLNQNTVFVIGAGASYDLGLPLGDGLKSKIAELCKHTLPGQANRFGVIQSTEVAPRISGLYAHEWQNYDLASRMLANDMPRAASIDNYLHNHSGNSHLIDLGKVAIALAISEAESKSALNKGFLSGYRDQKDGGLTKYFLEEFLPLLVRGHTLTDIRNSLKNLSFIIFNYDRCVEHYLVQWLSRNFGSDLSDAVREDVNFVHVYGSLGDYFSEVGFPAVEGDKNGAIEVSQKNAGLLRDISHRIKTFTEAKDDGIKNEISNLLIEAENVAFIGFGFEEQNMDVFSVSCVPNVFATAFGFSDEDISEIRQELSLAFDTDEIAVRVSRSTGAQLFFEHSRRLRRSLGTYVY